MSDKPPDSTRDLLAGAEQLAGKRREGKAPSTRQLVVESEQLIGRDSPGGGIILWVVVAIVLCGAGAAFYFLM